MTLHRSHSSNDLTTAIRQIELADIRTDERDAIQVFVPRKSRPRHARMWSLNKRKNRSLERHTALNDQADKAKRAKHKECGTIESDCHWHHGAHTSKLQPRPNPMTCSDRLVHLCWTPLLARRRASICLT